MSRKISISVVQMEPRLLAPARNLSQMNLILSGLQSDMIIFPELCSSGYNFKSRLEVRRVAEPARTGPLGRLLRRWSRLKNCAIVSGFPERRGNKIYNSAAVSLPRSFHVVRKIHLFFRERIYFSPSRPDLKVFRFKGFRFGVMICFDWFFPEVTRGLALKGADLVAHPSNLVLPYAPEAMRTRSLENRIFSATANRVGTERGLRFTGLSQVVDTKGSLLGRLPSRGVKILTVRINPLAARDKNITSMNHALTDRRIRSF